MYAYGKCGALGSVEDGESHECECEERVPPQAGACDGSHGWKAAPTIPAHGSGAAACQGSPGPAALPVLVGLIRSLVDDSGPHASEVFRSLRSAQPVLTAAYPTKYGSANVRRRDGESHNWGP